ncbi:indole-3-glycerol phosphate synthase TrpC [Patescibacteria group bacterium]|nr:indole-3-glycerol phosphate synthase TrpC [Patescibacteria group bacterium]
MPSATEQKPSVLIDLFNRKKAELTEIKGKFPLQELKQKLAEREALGEIVVRDFTQALTADNPSLIAEIKKASPSAGDINEEVDIEMQAKLYEKGGANAISVLTEKSKFKGDIGFINRVKKATKDTPVLRKDFIFDPYQIYESKYYGADAVLLITTMLDEGELNKLVDLTHELGMECLVEIHTVKDLTKALQAKAQIIGINARNLHTFGISLDVVVDLAAAVPEDKILIAESGIKSAADVKMLHEAGVQGILVGTTLMESNNVAGKIRELKLL